jgi:Xaa-Pro aminopeptidase
MTNDNIEALAARLTPAQLSIIEQEYPHFSDAEMDRRRELIGQWLSEHELDHILVYGAYWAGNGVGFFTGWPVTAEAAVVFSSDTTPAMYVQFYNHVPEATHIAYQTEVGPGGESTIETAIATMEQRGKANPRVGVVGPLPMGAYRALEARTSDIVDLNRTYFGARMIKSEEEFDWLKIGAVLSDLSYEAVLRNTRIGDNERALGDYVERAYLPWGATNLIHFFGVTSMDDPNCCVPRQWPLTRKVANGDVVFTEISADFWDYSGQILRTFTVGADPTPLYQDLHAAADAAFDAIVAILKPGATAQDIVDASGVIEQAGFSIYDDLVHGYGGGYLPPVLGSKSRPAGPIPDLTLAPGMCMVVQPNVITTDEKAGVQTGEAVRITETGVESLHGVPRGMQRIDPA